VDGDFLKKNDLIYTESQKVANLFRNLVFGFVQQGIYAVIKQKSMADNALGQFHNKRPVPGGQEGMGETSLTNGFEG